MKLIALILGIIMVCGVATGALANNPDAVTSDPVQSTSSAGVAVLNTLCTVEESYEDSTGTIEAAKAENGKEYKLVLSVNNTGDTLPPAFVYNLPARVQTAKNGSDSKVGIKWAYDKNNGRLIFNWNDSDKVMDSFTVKIDVVLSGFDLYNMAVIKVNNVEKWYHLAKTVVNAEKPYDAYADATVVNDYCQAAAYDFTTTKVVYGGKEYVYCGNENDLESILNDSKPYYTVEFMEFKTSKRITDPKYVSENLWMLPEGVAPYSDDNDTGGYHRNYRITLCDVSEFVKQPLFNFLKGKDNNYYRLKKTEIYTTPISTYTSGQRLTEGTYYVLDGGYDFSDLVLTFDNKEYRYSDKVIKEGQYDNYYTIEPSDLLAKNVFHGKANWFFDEKGWIDGAKETYTAEELKSNNYWGFHQDYIAKFYSGNATFYSVNMYDGEEKITTARILKDSAAELQEPEKEGYRFIGWKTEDGTDYDMTTPVKGNINLYADWAIASSAERSIEVSSSWPSDVPAYIGTKITLTAHLTGYDGLEIDKDYTIQWQYRIGEGGWNDIQNANEMTYVFILDEQNTHYSWRAVAIDAR
jgi:uncharacterized repeat protein (TIGR02543 family)